ncbi:MAG: hypothetical protein EBQ89_11185 [Alphaproteobacteria bacterium]|nr:hypothetical protein [Alphaproteobacteria bacterium]
MTFWTNADAASIHHPIDIIEEIVEANRWLFERAHSDEMVVELAGRWCHYRLFFVWQAEISALQFSCQFDLKVPPERRGAVLELLSAMNTKLWLGHFEVNAADGAIIFRHALLLRGARATNLSILEDMVEIALTECERFYPACQFVIWGGKSPDDAINAAMIDTAGQA